jgi:hypothetical protein
MNTYDKQTRQILSEYKKQLRHFLVTSRFNNSTWEENQRFRDKLKDKIGCIYCSPDRISEQIPLDTIVFVLEMNNDTNQIMGIGMIRNHPKINRYQVYENGNYNRYNYMGKYRVDRAEMVSEEEQLLLAVLDTLCFKGNKHMKRGQGLKCFPIEILYRCKQKFDLLETICKIFKERININESTEK